MNKKELFKSLNNLCCEMQKKSYNINNGGCCFVAAVIAEQLETYNIPFYVAVTYCPTHYAIKVKDRYINRDDFKFGPEDLREWNSRNLYYTYNDGDWNDWYSRCWNLIVKTRIRSIFKKYENNRT